MIKNRKKLSPMNFIFLLVLILSPSVFSMETKLNQNKATVEKNFSQKETLFELHILRSDLFKKLGKTYEQAMHTLKKVDLSIESDFLITEYDIEKYHWLEQSIELSLEKSMEMLKKYLSEDISLKYFMEEKHSWSELEFELHTSAFLVTFENEILYGGIFIQKGTSLGPSYPVIYLEPGPLINLEPFEFQQTLIIRPSSLVLHSSIPYKFLKHPIKKRVEICQVYNLFLEMGKLTKQERSGKF
jgi:hypothetical protein